MKKEIWDKDLGVIELRTHSRATRYTLRVSKGKIRATMPVGGDERRMIDFIQRNKPRLIEILQKHPVKLFFDEQTQLQTATFQLRITCADREDFSMRLDDGILSIVCPRQTDFRQEAVQDTIKLFLEKALRHEAKRLLPSRIMGLAERYGFEVTNVRIHNSKTRWGSCSQRKSINLSLSLMLLPWHLIDYVLLHELCHTVEMNHSDRFWALMDRVTDGKALVLRKELRSYAML